MLDGAEAGAASAKVVAVPVDDDCAPKPLPKENDAAGVEAAPNNDPKPLGGGVDAGDANEEPKKPAPAAVCGAAPNTVGAEENAGVDAGVPKEGVEKLNAAVVPKAGVEKLNVDPVPNRDIVAWRRQAGRNYNIR